METTERRLASTRPLPAITAWLSSSEDTETFVLSSDQTWTGPAGSKDYQLVTWSRDQTLRIWRVDPQLQQVRWQLQRHTTVSSSARRLSDVVVVQLCSSDGVEDLLESLTMDSPKSLTSPEPEGHHRAGPAADLLQGESSAPPVSPLSHLFDLSPLCPLCPSSDLDSGSRQDSVLGSGLPQTLQQEFSLVNLQIRNVNVEVRRPLETSSRLL